MWLFRVKEMPHGLQNVTVRRHVHKLRMIDPMSSGIQSEGKVTYGVSVDFVIELEEDSEASLRKDGMRSFGKDVKV